MIKTKFGFFQMQIKGLFRHTIKLGKSSLGITPKRFDSVNVASWIGEFIFAMLDSVVLVISNIYQTIVTGPTIRMNHTFQAYFPTYNMLKRLLLGVWHDFSVHFAPSFEDAKDNGFPTSTAASAGYPLGTKVRFIHFDGASQRDFLLGPAA